MSTSSPYTNECLHGASRSVRLSRTRNANPATRTTVPCSPAQSGPHRSSKQNAWPTLREEGADVPFARPGLAVPNGDRGGRLPPRSPDRRGGRCHEPYQAEIRFSPAALVTVHDQASGVQGERSVAHGAPFAASGHRLSRRFSVAIASHGFHEETMGVIGGGSRGQLRRGRRSSRSPSALALAQSRPPRATKWSRSERFTGTWCPIDVPRGSGSCGPSRARPTCRSRGCRRRGRRGRAGGPVPFATS
jgi:hypothetical protein